MFVGLLLFSTKQNKTNLDMRDSFFFDLGSHGWFFRGFLTYPEPDSYKQHT